MAFARPGSLLAQAAASSPPSSTINIALVGIGLQGRILMEALLNIPGVRFVAVCDIWEYARTYGQRYLQRSGFSEVAAFENHQDMLDKVPSIDAVIVATTDSWHAPVTNDALRAGKHVYCEKMMAHTEDAARSMVAAMRETGRLLQIGHQRRSNPRYLLARNRLLHDARLLGRITAAQAQWNRGVSPDLGWPQRAVIPGEVLRRYGFTSMHQFRNWRWFKDHGGGPLSDLGAHQIDIFNWFLNRSPATVFGSGGTDYYNHHEWMDNAMVIYEYPMDEGIARAFYQVQTTTSSGGGYWEQFMGDEGTMKLSENPRYTALYREATAPSWEEWVRRRILAPQPTPPPVAAGSSATIDARETAALAAYNLPVVLNKPIHQPHLENFFQAVRGEARLTCPADEAFRSEVVIYRAIEAVEQRRLITFQPSDFDV
ncbi:MAG: gfo/Idh/MocA family oxidoreductase [Puniceicoccaceae bacterium]|nr:MAG: gfo/Idh/MocA family oxidoreductase [Puniceicoccaceae bacterium]